MLNEHANSERVRAGWWVQSNSYWIRRTLVRALKHIENNIWANSRDMCIHMYLLAIGVCVPVCLCWFCFLLKWFLLLLLLPLFVVALVCFYYRQKDSDIYQEQFEFGGDFCVNRLILFCVLPCLFVFEKKIPVSRHNSLSFLSRIPLFLQFNSVVTCTHF